MTGKSKARQIVVVDDDPDVLTTLVKVLKTWGYDPVPFTRFEDARTFLSENAADILIVDVRLGTYNGLQLVHLVRQNHPEMRVVAVSGYDDPVLRAAAEDAGAAYFLKPIEFPHLREHLAAAAA
jgi:two-component system response regulator PilR (NtrC family)